MSRVRDLALHALRAAGGFAVCRFLTRKQLRVLCYHGFSIRDEYQIAPGMFIRAQTFERRMAVLQRRRFTVLALDEAVKRFVAGEINNAETVITFDDGWASNLTIGVPILEKYRFPACVYVTTEHLTAAPEVFNVALSYLVRKSGRASVTLSGIHPQLDGEYRLSDREDQAIVEIILAAERAFPLAERQHALQAIATALGMSLPDVLAGDRFRLLTDTEMREIYRHNVDIQLHTHSHRLPDTYDALAREIGLNCTAVSGIVGVRPTHFCYPSGEYTARHAQWLSGLGIVSGTTCDPGLNDRATSVMLLKRFLDSDAYSDISFEAEVCGVREIARRVRARLSAGSGNRPRVTAPGSP
jgi:peptidoglycan/xylan/chitin deacetylase (PgdA/CDA1 family)